MESSLIENVKKVAAQILPKGSALYLYGSRARGDYREDSDWDFLLLLDKPKGEADDFNKFVYPIMEQGFDQLQYCSVHAYTKDEWHKAPHSMFYFNVEQDKQLLYES